MHPLYSYWWSEDKKSLSMCVHVMQAVKTHVSIMFVVTVCNMALPGDVNRLY